LVIGSTEPETIVALALGLGQAAPHQVDVK
jgi:hypothetical protein